MGYYQQVSNHMEIWSQNKMEIIPSCKQVRITVFFNHLNSNEIIGDKARWKLHNNTICCSEHILEVALYKTTVVQSLNFHLTNHPSKTCWALLEKQESTHK